MRALSTEADAGALAALYRDLELPSRSRRPFVYLDFVTSADGAASLHGRAGPLGGEADRIAFARLREAADAILVGAETVRVEGYGPASMSPPARDRRRARGQEPEPRMVVATRSADLDPESRLFREAGVRPLVLTVDGASPKRLAALRPHAEVLAVGETSVDWAGALAALATRGIRSLLCEGGPRLAAQLVAERLVDELFLTISPLLVGGSAPRMMDGPLPVPAQLELKGVIEHEGELMLRYSVR